LDSIERAEMPLGRVELKFGIRSLSTDVWIGSARRFEAVVSPWHANASLDEDFAKQVPTIGPAIADLIRLKRERLPDVKVARLVRASAELRRSEIPDSLSVAVADLLGIAAAFDDTVHDCPADVLPSEDAKTLIAFWIGTDTVAPEALARLAVCRWRQALDRVIDERNDEQESDDLLAEWRATLLTGEPCRLSRRPGGYHLTDAARRYCQAVVLPSGKLRNQALTLVLLALEQAQAQSKEGTTVRTVADILRQLALKKSDRQVEADRIAALERPTVLAPAINELKAYAHLPAVPERSGGLGLGDLLPINCSQLA
jgi:hypothetical protein